MLEVIAALLVGLLLGRVVNKYNLQKHVSKFTLFGVIGLLFIMGVEIGSNPQVFAELPILGTKALVLAFATAAGSVLVSLPLARSLQKADTPTEGTEAQ